MAKSFLEQLRERLAEHDGCSRYGTKDMRLLDRGNPLNSLEPAIVEAKAALVGDSNDAEHDALVELVEALGEGEVPECDCEERSWYGEGHDSACPCKEWEAK